jgi:hypothetical protein
VRPPCYDLAALARCLVQQHHHVTPVESHAPVEGPHRLAHGLEGLVSLDVAQLRGGLAGEGHAPRARLGALCRAVALGDHSLVVLLQLGDGDGGAAVVGGDYLLQLLQHVLQLHLRHVR